MFYTYMRITLVGYIHASLDIMFLPAPPNILLTYTEDTTNKAYSACFPGIHGTTGFRTRNSAAPNLSTSNQPWAISPSVPSVAFPITHTRALISKMKTSTCRQVSNDCFVRRSVISKYVLNPYWNRLVTLWPLWVAPNTVSFFSFVSTKKKS